MARMNFPGGTYRLDQGRRRLTIEVDLDTVLEKNRGGRFVRVATLGFPGEERLQDFAGHDTSWSAKLIVFRSLKPDDVSAGERTVEILRDTMKYRLPPKEEQMLVRLYEAVKNNPEPLKEFLSRFPEKEDVAPRTDPTFGERKEDFSG